MAKTTTRRTAQQAELRKPKTLKAPYGARLHGYGAHEFKTAPLPTERMTEAEAAKFEDIPQDQRTLTGRGQDNPGLARVFAELASAMEEVHRVQMSLRKIGELLK